MAQNIKHKPKKALKSGRLQKNVKSSRRPAGSFSCSDDDYSGVDLVSDSEDEDAHVILAEERAIVDSENDEEDDTTNDAVTPTTLDDEFNADDDQLSWAGFADDTILPLDPGSFFADATDNVHTVSSTMSDTAGAPEPRKVHFNFSDDSDAEDEEEEINNIFPDIFIAQDQLDPRFRRELETEDVSDDGSFWDFAGESAAARFAAAQEAAPNDDASGDSESSSCFNSDSEGETTEDEEMPMAHIDPLESNTQQSVLRRESTDSNTTLEEEDVLVQRRAAPVTRTSARPLNKRSGPALAAWVHDRNRPFAYADTEGGKIIVVKKNKNGVRYPLSDNIDPKPSTPSLFGNMSLESPMISNTSNVMMSAMQDLNDAAGAPLGAFYPYINIDQDGQGSQDRSSVEEEDGDMDPAALVGEFFDFGVYNDDDDGDADNEDDNVEDENVETDAENIANVRNLGLEATRLLEHLDRTKAVGSFRRNQDRHALITRSSASKASLAFSGAFGSPVRGIKSDRMAAANSPITPIRRTKATAITPSLRPFIADSPLHNKRKLSDVVSRGGHKRNRSLV